MQQTEWTKFQHHDPQGSQVREEFVAKTTIANELRRSEVFRTFFAAPGPTAVVSELHVNSYMATSGFPIYDLLIKYQLDNNDLLDGPGSVSWSEPQGRYDRIETTFTHGVITGNFVHYRGYPTVERFLQLAFSTDGRAVASIFIAEDTGVMIIRGLSYNLVGHSKIGDLFADYPIFLPGNTDIEGKFAAFLRLVDEGLIRIIR